ncbi:hypothetical protein EVAR_40833_1 [Eumeta japonica]|uniref:Uncharacterized protein n=1 Tax=Eumeta variegata TaxID=151549 RepID=A0A4C1WGK3_EUMVA|nr:hypothetical protein EVAR_40833_1 [Eumeta japonica]
MYVYTDVYEKRQAAAPPDIRGVGGRRGGRCARVQRMAATSSALVTASSYARLDIELQNIYTVGIVVPLYIKRVCKRE